MATSSSRELAYVIDAVRTPRGKGKKGALSGIHPQDYLSSQCIELIAHHLAHDAAVRGTARHRER